MIAKPPSLVDIHHQLSTEKSKQTGNFGMECKIASNVRKLLTSTQVEPDEHRMVGFLSAHRNDEPKLEGSLHRLFDQLNEINLACDLLLAGNAGGFFDRVLMQLEMRADVEVHHWNHDIQQSQVLGREVVLNDGESARITDAPREDQHRVFSVHQPQSIHSDGKIGGLRTLADLLIDSIGDRTLTKLGALSIDLDAESWIFANGELCNNGIEELLKVRKSRELGSVSSRVANVRYFNDGHTAHPVMTYSKHPYFRFFDNQIQGWYPNLTNMCTIGETLERLALRFTVTNRYKTGMEDYLMAAMSHQIGTRWDMADHTHVTNCVTAHPEEQLLRWFKSKIGLLNLFGSHPFDAIKRAKINPTRYHQDEEYQALCKINMEAMKDPENPLLGKPWTPNPAG